MSQRDAPCEIIFYAGGLQMERTMKLRLVFTTLGPLTLGLLFAAYSHRPTQTRSLYLAHPALTEGMGAIPLGSVPDISVPRHFVLLRYKNETAARGGSSPATTLLGGGLRLPGL